MSASYRLITRTTAPIVRKTKKRTLSWPKLTKLSHWKRRQKKGKKKFGEKTDEFKKALEKAQTWGKKYKSADDIPDSEIPDQHDFTNIDGYDFTNPVRDQGACGSCYTVSFT